MKNACLALVAPLSTPALIRCERAYPAAAMVWCGLSPQPALAAAYDFLLFTC